MKPRCCPSRRKLKKIVIHRARVRAVSKTVWYCTMISTRMTPPRRFYLDHAFADVRSPSIVTKRNKNSRLNTEIREEVKAFTSRATCPLSDEEFLELENNVRELHAKYGRTSFAPRRKDGRESTTMIERSGGGSGQNSTTVSAKCRSHIFV